MSRVTLFDNAISRVLFGIMLVMVCLLTPAATRAAGRATNIPAILGQVSIGDRLAEPGELQVVQIIRQGRRIRTELNMPLCVQDEVQTGPYSGAVLVFQNGTKVYLAPNTRVRIQSIWVEIGKLFVKVKDFFLLKDKDVTSTTEGTEFHVVVTADGLTTMTGVRGAVLLNSNYGTWQRRLGRFDQLTASGPYILQERRVSQSELDAMLEWVHQMDELAQDSVTSSGSATGTSPGSGQPSGSWPGTDPMPSSLVPDVVGQPVTMAESLLYNHALHGQPVEVVSGQHPAGIVLWQRPAPGWSIPAWSAVEMGVEAGVYVPSLLDMHYEEARSLLQQAGLTVGQTRLTESMAKPQHTVLQQSPQAGALVRVNSPVNLDISTHPQTTSVPDVVGEILQQARILIHGANLQVGEVRQTASPMTGRQLVPPSGSASASTENWLVTQQSPPAGKEVQIESRVDVWIAEPAITPTPTPSPIPTPTPTLPPGPTPTPTPSPGPTPTPTLPPGPMLRSTTTPMPIILYDAGGWYSGDLQEEGKGRTGREGADNICKNSPNKPAHYSSFLAFLSVDSNDEIRDMPYNYGVPLNIPIQSITNEKIAGNWNDLLDGTIATPLVNAGVLENSFQWWSGSTIEGGILSHCFNWEQTAPTSPSLAEYGTVGISNETGAGWIAKENVFCEKSTRIPSKRILCIAY